MVFIAAVVLLATYGGQIWRLWGDVLRNNNANNVAINSQDRKPYSTVPIIKRQLFGNGRRLNSAAGPVSEPTTRSSLTLQAIFASPKQGAGSAIISGPNFEARTFSVNSTIGKNITVVRIEDKRVVLDNDGRLESLEFPAFNANTLSFSARQSDPESRVSSGEFEQLISVLEQTEQTRLSDQVGTGDISALMQALSEDQKLLVVRKRMEQLRQSSAQSNAE